MEEQKRKRNMSAHLLPLKTASVREKCRLIAGRIGVIAAVIVFVGTYVFGISKYGVLLGIALGWLPCGMVAWLAAITVAAASNQLLHYSITLSCRLALFARIPHSEVPNKN